MKVCFSMTVLQEMEYQYRENIKSIEGFNSTNWFYYLSKVQKDLKQGNSFEIYLLYIIFRHERTNHSTNNFLDEMFKFKPSIKLKFFLNYSPQIQRNQDFSLIIKPKGYFSYS